MPAISRTVHHQPTAASANSSPTRPRRTRTAAKAGARPSPAGRTCAGALTGSRGPGELRRRQPGLPLVPDAERVDPRPLRLGHGQVRPGRVEHAVEADRGPVLLAERNDVLDLEVDDVADPDAVQQPVVAHLDRGTFDADDLPHEGGEPGHRT